MTAEAGPSKFGLGDGGRGAAGVEGSGARICGEGLATAGGKEGAETGTTAGSPTEAAGEVVGTGSSTIGPGVCITVLSLSSSTLSLTSFKHTSLL